MDTSGASEGLPAYLGLVGEILMGTEPKSPVEEGQCFLIHTGGMLPEGADAVVMLEDTQTLSTGEIEVFKPVSPGENLIEVGEDIRKGEPVIPKGTRLRSAEIGGLMALGFTTIKVVKPPLFGLISSGDEVIPPGEEPSLGQIRDINTYSLASLIQDLGARTHPYGIIPDSRDEQREVMTRALRECDHLVVTAGSSASTRDLTAEIMNELGDPGVIVHGLQIKPGKPTILGLAKNQIMIGLPGNPVSALVIALVMIKPILDKLLGLDKPRPQPVVEAELTVNIPSQAGREDWIPVRLIKGPARVWQAEPVFGRSNLIFVLTRADGLIKIPPSSTGLEAGTRIPVQLMG
jgi:molybdopterin molybdotransferase